MTSSFQRNPLRALRFLIQRDFPLIFFLLSLVGQALHTNKQTKDAKYLDVGTVVEDFGDNTFEEKNSLFIVKEILTR